LNRLYARLTDAEWVAQLAVRLCVGIEFFGSGLGKLGKLPGLVQYFRSLGIPAPEIQAPFVASVEFLCGMLLVVGLATRPAALMLCGVMVVAIVTAAAPEKHIQASGRASLDAWLSGRGPGTPRPRDRR
jgi:putative oxidoreductase